MRFKFFRNKRTLFFILILLMIPVTLALTLDDISPDASDTFADILSNFFSQYFGSQQITSSCSNCNIGSCTCSVGNCNSGVVDIYEKQTCGDVPKYSLSFSGSQFTWIPENSGTHSYRILCDDGSKSSCLSVNVGSAGSTTTIPGGTTSTTIPGQGELEIGDVNCNKGDCTIDVTKNTLSESLVFFFKLIDDDGVIYYSANLNLEPQSRGKKDLIISRVTRCPSGTDLELWVLVYKQNDLNNRIKRKVSDSFVC